jgi:hypothetical protein
MRPILELDHPPTLDIDQMVVFPMLGRLIPCPPTTKVPPLQDALLLEQPNRAVHRRDRHPRIQRDRPAIHFLHVRMVRRIRQHAGDDPALPRHLQPPFDAKTFDA